MRNLGVSPWTVAQLLASDVLTWAVGQAAADGKNVPAVVYLDRLAERVGMTRRQLFRILAGETSPTVEQLLALCRAIGSTRAVAALAEESGVKTEDAWAELLEPRAGASRKEGAHAAR